MIHRHMFSIRRVLVDQRVTTVTEVNPGPYSIRLKKISAIVLGAADAEVGIGRVDRNALKLCCAKGRGVAIDPLRSSIERPPDTAIVTGINNQWIGRCDANHVAINVERVGAGRKY